jgi:hypothetical protein
VLLKLLDGRVLTRPEATRTVQTPHNRHKRYFGLAVIGTGSLRPPEWRGWLYVAEALGTGDAAALGDTEGRADALDPAAGEPEAPGISDAPGAPEGFRLPDGRASVGSLEAAAGGPMIAARAAP